MSNQVAKSTVPKGSVRQLAATPVSGWATLGSRWTRGAVLKKLSQLSWGSLEVHFEGQTVLCGNQSPESSAGVERAGHANDICAELTVHDQRFWGAIATRGSIGAGEAFMQGWWSTPNLVHVIRVMVRNQHVLGGVDGGLQRISRPFLRFFHGLRGNSTSGSRKNISAHYDVSNDFFALFLDPTMSYSCGIYEGPESTLTEASLAKIDRLCRKLELSPQDHLLEIGTGWGALAVHAAQHYGCRVTTTTISKQQFEGAQQRIREAGLEDRIELLFSDYRDLTGQYDKLVSVEMIEAVGHRYYGTFFESCARLLKPNGEMCLQAITIADQYYEGAKGAVDFIQRYIFPGSCIPSVTALLNAATQKSDLKLFHTEDITVHYTRTLSQWRENLKANQGQCREMGFDDAFLRMWEFYFAYCEGGFAERHIGDVQLLFTKPNSRKQPLLGDLKCLGGNVGEASGPAGLRQVELSPAGRASANTKRVSVDTHSK